MRIVRRSRAWILVGLVCTACADTADPVEPLDPAASLHVEPDSVRIAVGDTVTLTATARTAGGTDLSDLVEWESGTPTTVSVSSTGRAVALGLEPGDSPVRLIARVRHGGAELSDTVSVTVFERRLRITGSRRLLTGRTHPLSLWETPIGSQVDFEAPGTWLSSDTTIATIGASGELRGVRTGEVTITARVGGTRDTARVRVEASGYTVVELGNLGGDSIRPRGLNERGHAVGIAQSATGDWRGFLWDGARMRDLGELHAAAVGDDGELVVGSLPPPWPGARVAAFWRDEPGARYVPLPAHAGSAVDVNATGTVLINGGASGFLWREGEEPIALDPPSPPWTAVRINDEGVVLLHQIPDRSVFWVEGELQPIGAMGSATALNDAKATTGANPLGRGPGSIPSAFVSTVNGRVDLGHLGGARILPSDINDREQVVGRATVSGGSSGSEWRGFPWEDGRIADLNALIESEDWVILDAVRINQRGEILARGRPAAGGPESALQLIPPG